MHSELIEFYESCSRDEKDMLQVMAWLASDIEFYKMSNTLRELKLPITQKELKATLTKAEKAGVIIKSSSIWNNSYEIHPTFLIHILPVAEEWVDYFKSKFNGSHYYSYLTSTSRIAQFRTCLYTLLFDSDEEYRAAEKTIRSINRRDILLLYRLILEIPRYRPFLKKIDPQWLSEMLEIRGQEVLYNLESIEEHHRFIADLKKDLPVDIKLPDLALSEKLFAGQWDEAARLSQNEMLLVFIRGAQALVQGNASDAFEWFQKGLKLQRKIWKATYFPTGFEIGFYYVCTLLHLDSDKSSPLIKKLIETAQKDKCPDAQKFYLPILYTLMNKKDEAYSLTLSMASDIVTTQENCATLFALPVFYLSEANNLSHIASWALRTVEKAYANGYYTIAYEAAYALKTAYQVDEVDEMYADMAQKLGHEPCLSLIRKVENWEKSLNLFLGFKQNTTKNAAGKGKSSRVVYIFSPGSKSIQPVLQTNRGKTWTVGRNIALKTFYEGKAEGMTEQDFRIATMVRHYKDYYSSYYDFSSSVYKELVGHPYIFLQGTNEIPVEFVAAKPVIRVSKQKQGYVISSDVTAGDNPIFIRKETNTRYLVYELTRNQQQILAAIEKEKVTVPEAGKEKLMQVLAEFVSLQLDVSSDLLTINSEQVNMREVSTDSRIRVQLLPLGNGLKAELFVKPFGDMPPYVKAGLGGKVLFQVNEKGERVQVKRNFKKEQSNENALLGDIQTIEELDINDGLMTFDHPEDALFLLEVLEKHADKAVIEWPEGGQIRLKASVSLEDLHVKIKSATHWFELQGDLQIDEDKVISLQQLLELSAGAHNRFIELSPGEFLALTQDMKKRLDELRDFSTTDKKATKINKFSAAALDGFFNSLKSLKTDKSWKEFKSQVEKANRESNPIPSTLKADLRPYQEDGYRWMSRLAAWNAGACLADDMGLGKTVQTLSILLKRCKLGPALVVCPVSVVSNWISEVTRFAPTLQVKTLGLSGREKDIDELQANDLLITSYGLLQSEEKRFAAKKFATIVLDEAHTIKNYATKTSKAAMQLQGDFRIALTGTPIQNHLGEIWNIFHFTNPGLLGTLQQFTDRYIKSDDENARKRLKKLISPFMLRRTKSKVLDELPPKTEIVKKISLSDEEMAFYEALRRKALENIAGDSSNAGTKHMQVLAEITKLRQAACNPLLIDNQIKIPSSKLTVLLSTINELIENKHRTLVFSQFVSHLAIVRKSLDKLKIPYQYLDGSTPLKEREASVRAFQNGEGDLFLISLKAGGLGLNLTSADYVIHLDPWWNPAVEDQASDRTHRIGQTRPVTIYRFVSEHTIEEKIIRLHNTKRDLAESLLSGADQPEKLSIDELIDLIKNG